MDITLGLPSFFKDYFERKLFLSILRKSHAKYLERKNKIKFEYLTDGIEYDFQFESEEYSNQTNPSHTLVVYV